jgi:hypothetical protein
MESFSLDKLGELDLQGKFVLLKKNSRVTADFTAICACNENARRDGCPVGDGQFATTNRPSLPRRLPGLPRPAGRRLDLRNPAIFRWNLA